MISRPDHKTAKALHDLMQHPAWLEVKTYLEGELLQLGAALRDTTDIGALPQLQGRARAIHEFLQLVASSEDMLRKFTSSQQTVFA